MLGVMKRPGAQNELWILFAHGAGAPSTSSWMKRYSDLLSQFGHVQSFDYPYMKEGRKRPDPSPRLLKAHRDELTFGKEKHGKRVVLAGKSMGGRMGCHLALEEEVLGVICFGYPLMGMSKGQKLRDQVLYDLQVPACFVQGTRDNLCPLELLRPILRKRARESLLHVVETGNHSLEPTKSYLRQAGITLQQQQAETMAFVGKFLKTLG